MQNSQQTLPAIQNVRDPSRSSFNFQPLDLNTNSTADRPAKRRLKEGNSVQDVEQTNLIPISEGNNERDRRYTTPLAESKYKVENEPILSTQRKNGSILKRSRIEGRRSINEPVEMQRITLEQENKKAKLAFKEDIQEINIVENWKEYNNIETTGVTTACHCNTF